MCATQYSPNMHWHAGLIWEVLAVSDPLCATVDGVSEPASTGKKAAKPKLLHRMEPLISQSMMVSVGLSPADT